MKTKIDIGIMGQRSKPKPLSPQRIIYSLYHFASLLATRGLNEELQNEVLKVAKGYPEGSLDFMYNNLDNVIMRCAEKLNLRNQTPRVMPQPNDEPAQPPEMPQPKALPPLVQRKSLFDEVDGEVIPTTKPPIENRPKWTTGSVQPTATPSPQPTMPMPKVTQKPTAHRTDTLAGFADVYKDVLPPEDYMKAISEQLKRNPPKNDIQQKDNEDDEY